MPLITYQNKAYASEAEESVLDALLRHEVDIPYACKAGVCHVCVMKCQTGEVPVDATAGLRDSEVVRGNFLACQCFPAQDIAVQDADDFGLFSQAKVIAKDFLSEKVCRFRMRTASDLHYRAGQFINLHMPCGEMRSYSLASLPAKDDFLELHVKRMPQGVMSNWLLDEVQCGEVLEFQGPFGDCFYMSDQKDSDILLIGTGTGLTPMIGILRDAIEHGHNGQISLYHGESDPEGLYLDADLIEFSRAYSNIRYFPCALSDNGQSLGGANLGRAADLAFANNSDLADTLVYLCGSPTMVDEAKMQANKCSAAPARIFADPFVTKDLRLGKDRRQDI